MSVSDFLFESVYQVVTWVFIALSIGGIYYFAGKSNRLVMWSIIALICSTTIMIGIIADREFFHSANKTTQINPLINERPKIESNSTPDSTAKATPPSPTPKASPTTSATPLSVTERPYVVVESAYIPDLAPNKPLSPVITIVNKGRTPAQHLAMSLEIAAKAGFVWVLGFGPDSGRRPVAVAFLASGDKVSVQGAPADAATLDTKFFNDAMEGKESFMIHGKGSYEDLSGSEYPIEYSFGYHPTAKGFVADFGGPNRLEKWQDEKEKQKKPAKKVSKGSKPEELTSRRIGSANGGAGSGAPSQTWHRTPYDRIKWTDYTEDYFYDAIWRWKYRPEMGNQTPRDIRAWCPECGAEVKPTDYLITQRDGDRVAIMLCSHCIPDRPFRIPGFVTDHCDRIRKLIAEKLRNGQWEEVVKRQIDVRDGRI